MELADITPIVLTRNEESNLFRSLPALGVFPLVLVIDSESTDATRSIASTFANVEIHERAFDTHATQWNFGLALARTDWILSLDGDYILGQPFIDEIKSLDPLEDVAAYFAPFDYSVLGRELQRSVLPPRAVLFRRDHCRYVDDGHTQRLVVDGATGHLQSPIVHDDRKPLDRWLASQAKYARLEAAKLTTDAHLGLADRIRRRKWIAPLAVFFLVLATGGLRDGWRGLYYAYQRMVAEAVLSLELIESDLRTVKASGADELRRSRDGDREPGIEG